MLDFWYFSEGDLEEVLTTYTKINKSAAIFLGGDAKPGATMSEAKREMLSRRRENPDITDGTVPIGTMDDASRMRQGKLIFRFLIPFLNVCIFPNN